MNNKLIAALILVSSFLLSSNEEKDQYKPKLPNFKDILEVKHSIPGRIRIQCKVLKDNPHGKQALLNTLDSLSHTIYEKTNGILDLKSSVMLLLGTYAVYDIKTRPGVSPAGITCLWWLYGLINRPN